MIISPYLTDTCGGDQKLDEALASFFLTQHLHLKSAAGILNKSPKLRDQQGYARPTRRFGKGGANVV
jgi:hypothetical protein